MRYSDATSFRQALGDHFRARYADQDLGRLLKRVAMERFLARTAHVLGDRALLKELASERLHELWDAIQGVEDAVQ